MVGFGLAGAGTGVEIAVDRFSAGFTMQVDPLPRPVADETVTGEVAGGFLHLLVVGGMVQVEDLVGVIPIKAADRAGEALQRGRPLTEEGLTGELRGVPSRQQRHARLLARVVDLLGGLWKEVAVGNGVKAERVWFGRVQQLLGRHSA